MTILLKGFSKLFKLTFSPPISNSDSYNYYHNDRLKNVIIV